MHALIIEDQPLIGMMLKDELMEMGYSSIDIALDEQVTIELVAARALI